MSRIVYFVWIFSNVISITCAFNLTILHTNDVHARIEQTNKYSAACSEDDANENKCFGGMARRHTVIESIRDTTDNVLLLDGGDAYQGTLWFNQYKGVEESLFMNLLGYDAMALGNHEFDLGTEGLAPFLENATFSVLSCNIDASNDAHINGLFMAAEIKEVGGERVGLIGYTTTDTVFLVDIKGIEDLVFKDEVESIQEEVNKMLELGVNKIIVIGHGGYLTDLHIAQHVKGIDMIIGGHSNTFLYTGEEDELPSNEDAIGPYPTIVTQDDGSQVLVVHAYAYGKYLGYIETVFNDEGVIESWQGNPILLDGRYEQDPEILALVTALSEPLNDIRGQVLGETYVFLDNACRLGECNLGNMICDALLEEHITGPGWDGDAWSDISLVMLNGGGFRIATPQGEITMEQVMLTLPFRNTVIMVRITGHIILEALEWSASQYEPLDPQGGFLQFSGFRVVYDVTREIGSRVVSVDVLCHNCTIPSYHPLDLNEEYNVLINSFMAHGGDGYSMIRDNVIATRDFGTLMADSVADFISRRQFIRTGLEGRIKVITTPQTTTTSTMYYPTHQAMTDRPLPPWTNSSPALSSFSLMSIMVAMFVSRYLFH